MTQSIVDQIIQNNIGTQSQFPSFLPLAKSVMFGTIAGGNIPTEAERIKNEVLSVNRQNKIDSLLTSAPFKEMKISDHPDYDPGLISVSPLSKPIGKLFYLDYIYTDIQKIRNEKIESILGKEEYENK